MQVEDLNDKSKTAARPYHVFCKNGNTVTVTATGYRRQRLPDDIIEFLDLKEAPDPNFFFRAEVVEMIVPSSSLSDTRNPVSQLEEQVKRLTLRMDFLEHNLTEVIVKAVRAAVRQGDV